MGVWWLESLIKSMPKETNKDRLEVRVDITADSRYKFDRKQVREGVRKLLRERGLQGKVTVSVAVVGERKMAELKKKYKKEEGITDVLSFCQNEGEEMPDGTGELLLGDVVVCYPQAKRQAMNFKKLLDDEIEFLVLHGVLHLLGIHHD